MRHQGETLALESGVDAAVRADLAGRGHVIVDGRGVMGGFQGIRVHHDTGVLMGGSDPRKDGLAIGW